MGNTAKSTALVFWLVPCQKDRPALDRTIKNLAKKYDSHPFEPHITLCLASLDTHIDHKSIIDNLCLSTPPIKLSIKEIHTSSKFAETLYFSFNPSAELSFLQRQLANDIGAEESIFIPHLSLLYAHSFPAGQDYKKEIGVLPAQNITFDTIKAIQVSLPFQNTRDILNWKTLFSSTMEVPL